MAISGKLWSDLGNPRLLSLQRSFVRERLVVRQYVRFASAHTSSFMVLHAPRRPLVATETRAGMPRHVRALPLHMCFVNGSNAASRYRTRY